MKDILNTLQELDLSLLEAKVFLLLTELGSSPVSTIARRGNIKRTNLYNILDRLSQKGLVTEYEKGNIRFFQATEPENLITIQRHNKQRVEESIESLKEILPSLETIKSPLLTKPKVRYYQGSDGIANLLDQILSNEAFDAFFNPQTAYTHYPKIMDRFLKTGNEKDMMIRELMVESKVAHAYVKKITNPNHQTKCLPKEYKIQADTLIFGDKIAFISYAEGAIAVLIESADIVQAQKMAFEIMWKSLK